MDQLLEIVNNNVQYAHWIMFWALIAAGFNVPVSEDAMIFIAALLSVKYPEYQTRLIGWVFAGAYFSDLIAYGLGRFLGPRIFQIRFLKTIATQERLQQVSSFYARFGIITLIFGRFIPFGVRNALFITAGLGRMRFLKFALADLLAAVISFSFFYTLYYKYGEAVIDMVKKGNLVLFSVAALVAAIWFYRSRRRRNTTPRALA